ncbi:MAG: rod shape-determining protein [Pseudomonadota bacterium]
MQGKLRGLINLAERLRAAGGGNWQPANAPVLTSDTAGAAPAKALQLASWSDAIGGGHDPKWSGMGTLRANHTAVLPVRAWDATGSPLPTRSPGAEKTDLAHTAAEETDLAANEARALQPDTGNAAAADTQEPATVLNRVEDTALAYSHPTETAAQTGPAVHLQRVDGAPAVGGLPPVPGSKPAVQRTKPGFFALPSLASDDVAVDLGTTTTLVWSPREGIVLDEPSVVAVQVAGGNRDVLAVGAQAKSMLGRTPDSIETIRPLRDGVVADFIAAEEMLRQFIGRAKSRLALRRPRVLVCVPAGSTPVERRAVYESTLAAGARSCMLVEEPVAAALGAGLPIYEPQGSMIVDIGGGTTDVAVMSLGGVLEAHSMRVAGHAMDNAIIKFIRRHHNLLIGEPNAERIKIEVGSAVFHANGHDVDVQIKGRDMRRGLPTEITLGPQNIAEALSEPLEDIAYGVQRTLERMPPELASDICDRGICLTGGGAMLERIDEELTRLVGVRAYRQENPRLSVIEGCGMILGDLDRYKNLLIKVD